MRRRVHGRLGGNPSFKAKSPAAVAACEELPDTTDTVTSLRRPTGVATTRKMSNRFRLRPNPYRDRISQVADGIEIVSANRLSDTFAYLPCDSEMTTQQAAVGYPSTGTVLAITGGSLMIVAGLLILGVSVFVIPHLNASAFGSGTVTFPVQSVPGFVGSVLAGVGLAGLLSGLVVLGSGVMLRVYPDQTVLFGVLMVLFSILGFVGTGGFVVGGILGIVGGAMTLMWKRPAVPV